MPTSPYVHIETYIHFLMETRPNSLLDVGLGNGKMGFIARDLLDTMLGERHHPNQWQIRIDGIEIFPDYIHGLQREIYDHIYIGDAFDILPRLDNYEMVVIGDILEHFEKQRAWEFLDRCVSCSSKYLILNLPLGENWIQPEIYGNPYERHLSFWTWSEVELFVWKYKMFNMKPGKYGSFLIRKEDYLAYKLYMAQNNDDKYSASL